MQPDRQADTVCEEGVKMGDQGVFPPTSTDAGPTKPSGEEFAMPDITTPPVAPPPVMPGMEGAPEPSKKGGILGMLLSKPVIAVLGIIVGAAAVYVAVRYGDLTIGPGGEGKGPQVMIGDADLRNQINQLQTQLDGYAQAVGTVQQAQEIAAELAERRQSEGGIEQVRQQVADMLEKQEKYEELEVYLEEINDAITTANEELTRMRSELQIVAARNEGLKGEVAKFESLVGKLEDANNRRVAVKDAIEESLIQLMVRLKESSPLVHPEFNKEKRIARAEGLQHKLERSNWAYPELIAEFTELFLDELKLNSEQHYFMAKLPIEVKGETTEQWCECLGLGTWAVYFQTIDRRTVGVFMNTADYGRPKYEFVTELTNTERNQIRAEIERVRPEDFDERVAQLPGAPKHVIKQKGGLARFFDLL